METPAYATGNLRCSCLLLQHLRRLGVPQIPAEACFCYSNPAGFFFRAEGFRTCRAGLAKRKAPIAYSNNLGLVGGEYRRSPFPPERDGTVRRDRRRLNRVWNRKVRKGLP
jgi:hypothetical protein